MKSNFIAIFIAFIVTTDVHALASPRPKKGNQLGYTRNVEKVTPSPKFDPWKKQSTAKPSRKTDENKEEYNNATISQKIKVVKMSARKGFTTSSPFLLNGGALRKNFDRRTLIGTIFGTIGAVVAVGEIYSRLGDGKEFDKPLPPPEKGWANIEEATIVFHGAGGPDAYTDDLSKKFMKSKGKSRYYTLVDWSKYSQDTLQASFNGQIIGKKVAMEILRNAPNLKSLHIIGISVGAFAADSLVRKYKEESSKDESNMEKRSKDVYLQLTLLDPFCLRGTVGVFYGAEHYGLKADYAQQFMNTDDPVPFTNFPLPKCAVTDVTNVRPPDIFGHDWPLIYFTKYCNMGIVPPSKQRPKGDILTINSISNSKK